VRRQLHFALLFALAGFASGQSTPAPSPPGLAFTNVTIIDTTGKRPGQRATVITSGARITEVGEPDKVRIPAGTRIIDGTGKYLMPGLWDMHMHLSYVTEHAFPLLIANGVTGVCDMGGDLEQIDGWRSEINGGIRLGPRIFRAGPVVDGPRTEEGKYRVTVTNPGEAREAVRSLQKRGVDFIKVYHFLSRESYFAVADEAKKLRIPFAGHIPNGVGPQEASEAGQRSIEHTGILLQSLMSLEKKDGRTSKQLTNAAFDTLAGETGTALFAAMVKNGTWHTPTLVVAQSFLLRPELAAKPDDRRKYIAPLTKEHWEKNNPVPANVSAEDMADRKQALQRIFEVVGKMRRADVLMLAGTDPPTRDVFPGFSLHDELGLLVKAGLTPLEAIQAATLNPAKCLGLSDSSGTIEQGKVADFVLLEADPLTAIANTQKIAGVVVAGKYLPKAALEEMLAKTEAEVAAQK
jgi:imidazolonepropionase-like amidohydrolase